MVRQRECQRNEMKADKFSREYFQQKHCSLNEVDLLFGLLLSFARFHGCLIVLPFQIFYSFFLSFFSLSAISI